MSTTRWTIEELTERVAEALAGGEPGEEVIVPQRNGRVREVPDARTIRWYQTTGMVDRPVEMRGRTALYGPRHLAQIVAIKRLQAEGRKLSEIQARLAGMRDEALARLAALPELVGSSAETKMRAAEGQARIRFWARGREEQVTAEAKLPRSLEVGPAAGAETSVSYAVRLDAGVLLVLDSARAAPDADGLSAIRSHAGALLRELRRRGLAPGSNPRRDDS